MGSAIYLQGIRNNEVSEISSTQLKGMHVSSSIAKLYNLQMNIATNKSTDMICYSPLINNILAQYQELFQSPQDLPPLHSISHKIH